MGSLLVGFKSCNEVVIKGKCRAIKAAPDTEQIRLSLHIAPSWLPISLWCNGSCIYADTHMQTCTHVLECVLLQKMQLWWGCNHMRTAVNVALQVSPPKCRLSIDGWICLYRHLTDCNTCLDVSCPLPHCEVTRAVLYFLMSYAKCASCLCGK